MKTVLAFAVCISVGFSCTRSAVAEEPQPPASAASAQASSSDGDELHFVNVLTVRGGIVSIDAGNGLVTIKSPSGTALTLQARNEKDLEAVKTGDNAVIQYFEGAQIGKKRSGKAISALPLKDGIMGESGEAKKPTVASVERVDDTNQEVTLKGTDGSLETIMVSNPEYLNRIKVGDHVVITHVQGLALSLNKES